MRIPAFAKPARSLGVALCLTALSIPSLAGPTITPGESHTFDAPDVQSPMPPFPPGSGLCITNPLVNSPGETGPLGLVLSGVTSAVGARCEVYQTNDFTIDDSTDNYVLAEVSGKVEVGGVLALIGAGRTKSAYSLDVLDVTDPNDATVVTSTVLGVDEITGTFSPGVSAGIGIEGGAPYIGGSGSIGVGISIPITLKRVDNTYNFGLHALLRRGRSYRLRVSTSGALDVEAGVGAGFVLLPSFGVQTTLPNLFDPQKWLDLLPLKNLSGQHVCGVKIPDLDVAGVTSRLPELKFTLPKLGFNFPKLKASFGSIGSVTIIDETPIDILSEQNISILDPAQAFDIPSDPTQLLSQLGLPTDVTDLFGCFVDILEGNSPLSDLLPTVGTNVRELQVTLDEDEIGELSDFVTARTNQILSQVNQNTTDLANSLQTKFDAVSSQLTAAENALSAQLTATENSLSTQVDTEFTNLNDKLDDTTEDDVRHKIELDLAVDDHHRVGRLMLPEAFGGQLELVREIVADTITSMLLAGQDVHNAEEKLVEGDEDVANLEYKKAFKHYIDAYQDAVQLP